jgi:diguanylate cyclase (GGDEF)-like protein
MGPTSVAEDRDDAAEERDQAAEERDEAAERSEARRSDSSTKDTRTRSATARREAASDRKRASEDRRASARERDHASVDDLTGAYLRGAGFVELKRDMAKARRNNQLFVLAFVDVDHLKAVNDSRGHAAGDRMLLEVANTFRAKLRVNDLIIRYGGDEFVCALPNLGIADAKKRLAQVNAALAKAPEHGSVSAGLAELQPSDSAEDLVARADAALYRARKDHRRR